MKAWYGVLALFFFLNFDLRGESFRTFIAGTLNISIDNPAGSSISLSYNNSAIIRLDTDTRFFRGVELDITAPQTWIPYRGSVGFGIHAEFNEAPEQGIADIEGRQISFEPLPGKIQNIYQIPVRPSHGLRYSPYASILNTVILPSSFPIVVRLMPVVKGISEELENMRFQLSAKPILSDEGAVRLRFRYPEKLQGKPFTILIDDQVVENAEGELLLREGDHHLIVLSEDYRNESRRFLVERARNQDIWIELKDPTPMVIFEAPENAKVFLDEKPVEDAFRSHPVTPGPHTVKFQVSDYMIIKNIVVQKGKTYRIALSVDVNMWETD
jgi:hypothetical protein